MLMGRVDTSTTHVVLQSCLIPNMDMRQKISRERLLLVNHLCAPSINAMLVRSTNQKTMMTHNCSLRFADVVLGPTTGNVSPGTFSLIIDIHMFRFG